MQKDTIAAISTPAGVGAVGMVRLSGPEAIAIAGKLFHSRNPEHRLETLKGYTGALGRVHDKEGPVDEVVAFIYRTPRSYTGEDVVELCCHGGMYAVRRVLRLCVEEGARPAQAGEFTRRAFLNGKMDLSQAEAVMDLIGAQGQGAMRAALAARDGALAQKIDAISEQLLERSAHIAAWSDYPEEDLAPVDTDELALALQAVTGAITELLGTYDRGRLLREGAATAIVGKPNVGKSTLMNLLAGQQRSIVTEIPGTTRDIVQDVVVLGEVTLNLLDTAGIRETEDIVEKAGVERSIKQLETADLILAVFDRSDPLEEEDRRLLGLLADKNTIAVINKTDLPPAMDMSEIERSIHKIVMISAQTGEGREALEQTVAEALELSNLDPAAALVANERQRGCLTEALAATEEASSALLGGMTLDAVGVCIDSALDSLLSITGKRTADTVVDQVFARFCVGK